MMTANEVRESFKKFFEGKGHKIVPSQLVRRLFEYLNQVYALSRTQTVKLSKIT